MIGREFSQLDVALHSSQLLVWNWTYFNCKFKSDGFWTRHINRRIV